MLRQYFEKKRKKKTASIFFFHIFERVAISRYRNKSLSYAKSTKRENFVFETGSIIPDTTNKNLPVLLLQVLEWNGVSLVDRSFEEVVQITERNDDVVDLVVEHVADT